MNKMNLTAGCTVFPMVINIELTDRCPLNCPYCYKELENSINLDFSVLSKALHEFSANGGKYVLLSGGEPLLYPHLLEAIQLCNKLGLKTSISTSGFEIDESYLNNLFRSGLNTLYISLNSHDPEINSLSRDGYEYAINAMELCQKSQLPYKLNSVIRHDNINLLPEFINFAKKMGALGIDILSNKPNKYGVVFSPLDNDDFNQLIYIFRQNNDYLTYQTCFTQLTTYFNKIS